jgi:hypothetical protein
MRIPLPRWWAGLVLTGIAALANAAEQAAEQGAGAKNASRPDLNGVWQGFVVEGKGEQSDRGPTHLELTIRGNHISAHRLDGEGGSLGEGNYKLVPGRLMLMNATEASNRGKRRTYLGICAVEPDVLKWCVATPGNKRPTGFETRGQQFLLILKRQK